MRTIVLLGSRCSLGDSLTDQFSLHSTLAIMRRKPSVYPSCPFRRIGWWICALSRNGLSHVSNEKFHTCILSEVGTCWIIIASDWLFPREQVKGIVGFYQKKWLLFNDILETFKKKKSLIHQWKWDCISARDRFRELYTVSLNSITVTAVLPVRRDVRNVLKFQSPHSAFFKH